MSSWGEGSTVDRDSLLREHSLEGKGQGVWTTLLSVAVDLFYVGRATLGGSNVAREDSSSPRGKLASVLLRLLVKEEPGL